MRKIWTDIEISLLKEIYSTTEKEELMQIFNCSAITIYYQAHKFRLHKTKDIIAKQARVKTSELSYRGLIPRFKKGHTPANKGKTQFEMFSPEILKKVAKTYFKPGHIPANSRPIGSERIDNKDGYILIKVSNKGTNSQRWKLKHRLIWEQANGSVPRGYNVQFKDGNKLNIRIDNLYLISRKDQMRNENSLIARYPKDLADIIRLRGALKRQIKRKTL